MAFFNEFKDRFSKTAQSVSEKARDGVEITRLMSQARTISNEITALHEKIGRIYVESSGTDYEALAPLCARVQELKKHLDEIQLQKLQLKNQGRCPECGTAIGKEDRFCSKCGARVAEAEKETIITRPVTAAAEDAEAPESCDAE